MLAQVSCTHVNPGFNYSQIHVHFTQYFVKKTRVNPSICRVIKEHLF